MGTGKERGRPGSGEAREDFLEEGASKGERETRTNNRSWLGTAGRGEEAGYSRPDGLRRSQDVTEHLGTERTQREWRMVGAGEAGWPDSCRALQAGFGSGDLNP